MTARRKPDIFTRFTSTTSTMLGRPWIFIIALLVLIVWAASGPFLGFSDTWQLIINTSTTIITFLMVFIIQNTQNRDNLALNIKLDVIMQKMGIEREMLLNAEDKDDKSLEKQKKSINGNTRKSTKRKSNKKT
jgi:low affinity Fe/Cu permease